MPGRYLLDTSILVALLRWDAAVAERLANAEEVYTSVVVLGELYFGALWSDDPVANRTAVDELKTDLGVLACDQDTAQAYGQLKVALRRKGRPIPDNDLWVAASAAQHGLTLAYRDRHFQELEGLAHEPW